MTKQTPAFIASRRFGPVAVGVLLVPLAMQVLTLAMDRSDLFGFPGSPLWGSVLLVAWLIGPLAAIPMGILYSRFRNEARPFATILLVAVAFGIANAVIGVIVIVTVYAIQRAL